MATMWWRVGALSGALGVAMGAFGAHALKERPGITPRMLEVWETANRYHLLHSFALLMVPMAPGARAALAKGAVSKSGWLFASGITLFSGSLYSMVLTGNTKLGAITPVGGLALIGGWVALAGGI